MRLQPTAAALLCLLAASGSSLPAYAQPLTPLALTMSTTTPELLPYWAAKDGAAFAGNGLDVTASVVTGGTTATATVLSGSVQLVAGGSTEFISAVANGAELTAVAVTTPVFSYVFEVAADIVTPADLKGKTLGIPAVGGNADFSIRVALQRFGLDPDTDVSIRALGSQNNVVGAFLSDQISGAVLQPPNTSIVEAKGAHPILDMTELNTTYPSLILYGSSAWVAANPDLVQRFVDSLVASTVRIKQDRPFSLDVMREWLKSDDEDALNKAYDFFVEKAIANPPVITARHFAILQQELGRGNPKVKDVDVSKFINSSFVQSAIDRGLGPA